MRLPTVSRALAGLWPGLFCAALVGGASMLGLTQNIERLSLDALFRARGPRDADPRVIIIAVDDAAVVRAGERSGTGWPLPRSYYARAVRNLKSLGAKTIAFDVLFSEPGPDPKQDVELAKQCRAAKVAQACAFQVSSRNAELPLDISASQLPVRFAVASQTAKNQLAQTPSAPNQSAKNQATGATTSIRRAVWASAPLPALAQGAATVGHVNVFPEVAGTLRRVPHLLGWRGQFYPSLSLAASAHFLDEKPVLEAKNRRIALAGRQIPFDSDGLTFINWIGAGNSYPKFGLNQLLDGQVPAEAIRGRLILIGVTALGAFENRATPFSGGIPAIDFQANAMDDILSNRLLRSVPLPLSLALLIGFPVVCALVTARRGGKNLWPVPLLMIGVAMLGWVCLKNNFVFPIGAPLTGGALAFAITAALGYRREWEAGARSDIAASSLARGTTLLSAALGNSGRDRERLIAIIRATAHETLGAREVFLFLDEKQLSSAGATLAETPNTSPIASSQERALIAARHAQELGASWIFPLPNEENRRARHRSARSKARQKNTLLAQNRALPSDDSPTENLLSDSNGSNDFARSIEVESALLRGETLVAAPLPRLHADSISSADAAFDKTAHGDPMPAPTLQSRQFRGALVAIGKRDGGQFGARDAALLETLAEGAALALENFGYAQALRGRIESANRDLENAYRLLAEQSAKLFAAVESIDAALVVCDADGRAAFVNAAGTRVLRGATPELGEPVASALAAGDLSELANLFDSLRFSELESPTAIEAADLLSTKLETTRGREILAAQFTPLISDDNQLIGAMLVVSDVSAQRELDRMKTDFVGFVAHELRTPLTTILGYASLLHQAAGRFSADQTRDMSSTIERHCRRMNSMISDLLDISRLESGAPLAVHRAIFDLDALCERLIDEQKQNLNSSHQLVLRCQTRPLELFGDSDRIEQVMLNLLSNAVKYSPDGGVITVSLQKMEGNIRIEVSDQGLGLSGDQIEKMFGKFYRTEDSLARGIKGNGLGLNLVRQLVEAHDGQIEVFSRRDQGERGSTFRITLPSDAQP